ncbi:MAG: tail fiber domain-containing protein [Acidimicrobiia bacterium]|nr:tail fiber domain-containing protein [Acidimicrobiia bacterium]MDH4305918.1 tail fiber domain-containing protein [Acidimicrobiia bacterium]MDH5293297.1 tail fiber domain-containing protein [Acidimicrobiia bacterium]
MNYSIQPPDDVIEASFSTEPDDVSVASIRIEASKGSETIDDLTRIEFRLPLSLTTNAGSVTPQAQRFADWEMNVATDADGWVFVAKPRRSPQGESWVFFLRDVEVSTGAGSTHVKVTEVRGGTAGRPVELPIRKVDPTLRIDYFYVTADPASVSDDLAVPSVADARITSGQSAFLTWATTAATSVSLHGPAIAGMPATGGLLPAGSDDATIKVNPTTTSTYTLVASNASAHAVAQVTITVTGGGPIEATSVAVSTNDNGRDSIKITTDADEALVRLKRPAVSRPNGVYPFIVLETETTLFKPVVIDVRQRTPPPRQGQAPEEANNVLFISYSRQVNPYAGAWLDANYDWQKPSDAAVKRDVQELDGTLEALMQMTPVAFKWKDGATGEVRQFGFVAQEVEGVLPELVGRMPTSDGSEGHRSMAYSPIDAVTVGAIQELKRATDQRLAQIEATIEVLSRAVSDLADRLPRGSSDRPLDTGAGSP